MSRHHKQIKTNAIRIIEQSGIDYLEKTYDASGGFIDGITAAEKTGTELPRCFKTLVLVGRSKENYVCVIPVAEELDLKKAAKAFGEKSVEMIHVRDITKVTGYIKGGCSPVGMKRLFPTAIDRTAERFERIAVSGGKVGLQIELDPKKLAELIHGKFEDLTRD